MQKNIILEDILKVLPSDDTRRLLHGRGGLFQGWEQVNIEIYPPVLWVIIDNPTCQAPVGITVHLET